MLSLNAFSVRCVGDEEKEVLPCVGILIRKSADHIAENTAAKLMELWAELATRRSAGNTSVGAFQHGNQLDQRHVQSVGQFFHGGKRGRGWIASFQFLKIFIVHAGSLSQSFLSQPFRLSQFFQSVGKTKVNGVH